MASTLLLDHSVASLTPENLTAMLRTNEQFGEVTVAAVTASPIGTGQMADSYRLDMTYSSGSGSAPSSVVAKVSSSDESSRQMAVATSAYLREVRFYQRLATQLDTRTPACFYAEITDDTTGHVAILEDMGPATSVDQLTGCDADQAVLALEQAATLHSSSWHRRYLKDEDWLPVEAVWNMLGGSIPTVAAAWLERFGEFLEPEHHEVVTQLGAEIHSWLRTLTDHRTLWHGDFRLDNMLFEAQGGAVPIAVVDWQSVASAPGIIDVSYFLGNSMVQSDREKHERDLVNDYHDRLVSRGVGGYSREQCWREYQAHALYGLVLTVPVSLGVQATERGDAMFGAMARRTADQIIDNESFTALASI